MAFLEASAFATDVVAGVGEFIGYGSGVARVPGSRRYADFEDCLRDIFDAIFSPSQRCFGWSAVGNA